MIPVTDRLRLPGGEQVPWEAFVKEFGEPQIKSLPGSVAGWRIVGLQIDRSGITSVQVHVFDRAGAPVPSQQVAFYWPDAPEDPGCGPRDGVLPEMRPGRCFSAPTKPEGRLDFAMGPGAYYFAPGIGPHAVWIYGSDQPSEVILGLGMLGGTQHWHYNVVFQWTEGMEAGGEVTPPSGEQGETGPSGSSLVVEPPDLELEPVTTPDLTALYQVPFPIPTLVSGRPVTRRGVHWGCQWYHGDWIQGWHGWRWEDWTEWARSMYLSWAVLLNEGDSALLPHAAAGGRSAVQVLLDAGIVPMVRFPSNLPKPFPHMAHVETLVSQVSRYNVPSYVLLGNEFANNREWVGQKVPSDWMERGIAWWIQAARLCIERGAVVGFPDGPDFPADPFQLVKELPARGYISQGDADGFFHWWEEGKAFYAGHFYGLNRPPEYPDDPVSRTALPLTEEEHRKQLGAFYKVWSAPLELINRQRVDKAWEIYGRPRSELTACWRGWERVAGWMKQHFGEILPMAMTEGGWTPGAIAGTTQQTIDDRWPKPIPETVAEYTLYIFNEAEHPMFAQCPWVSAAVLMRGSGEWEGDAWRTSAYEALGYGRDMPVVQALRSNPPPELGLLARA